MTSVAELPARQKTKLLYSRCPVVPTNSSVAYQLGLMSDELRNEPELDIDQRSVALDPQLNPPEADRLWLRHAGHAKAVWARAKGADTRLVAMSWMEGSYPIYVSAASGIASPAGLKGKRIGVVRFTDTVFDLIRAQQLKTYEAALESCGLSLDDVEIVDIDMKKTAPVGRAKPKTSFGLINMEFVPRLVRREVDAIAVKIPSEIVDFFDVTEIYDSRSEADFRKRVNPGVLRCVVVSGPLLRERRGLIVRILARLLEAGEWAKAHPDETVRLLATDLKIDERTLRLNFEDLSSGIQIDNGPRQIEAMRTQKDFMLRHGLIDRDFDLEQWIDTSLLDEARMLVAERSRTEKRA